MSIKGVLNISIILSLTFGILIFLFNYNFNKLSKNTQIDSILVLKSKGQLLVLSNGRVV